MSQTSERFLKLASLTAIVLIGVFGVYAARGVFADGAYFLVEMLPRGGLYIFDPPRAYVQILMQAPVALAIWCGVLDLNSLIRWHSFGLVGVPLLFWLGALVMHYKSRLFWFFLMAFTVTYLRSNFFAAGEYSTAYGITAFCAAVLLRQQISHAQTVLMVLMAIALTHSYEVTLISGVFLAVLAAIRLYKVPTDRLSVQVLVLLSLVIFLISAYVGGRSALFERAYNSKSAANLSAMTEIHILYLAAMPMLITLLCTDYARRFRALLLGNILLIAVLYVLYTFRWDHSNISFGFFSYAYRTLCCFLLLGVLSLATALRFWPQLFNLPLSPNGTTRHLAIGAIAFFATMTGLMLYHTHGYYQWAQRFEQEAIALQMHTPINQTGINPNGNYTNGYNWGWANPSLSILLRGNAEAMVLNHIDNRGVESSRYENVRAVDTQSDVVHSTYDPYPLKHFEKKGLLFSDPN
jgi:hypothetical protein